MSISRYLLALHTIWNGLAHLKADDDSHIKLSKFISDTCSMQTEDNFADDELSIYFGTSMPSLEVIPTKAIHWDSQEPEDYDYEYEYGYEEYEPETFIVNEWEYIQDSDDSSPWINKTASYSTYHHLNPPHFIDLTLVSSPPTHPSHLYRNPLFL